MTSIKESTGKKLQLLFSSGAVLIYRAYALITLCSGTTEIPIFSSYWFVRLAHRGIMLLPYLTLLGAAIISNKLKNSTRFIPLS